MTALIRSTAVIDQSAAAAVAYAKNDNGTNYALVSPGFVDVPVGTLIDIRKYSRNGSKFNGTTDDTDALVAALADTTSYGAIYIPPGVTVNVNSIDVSQRRICIVGQHEGGYNSGSFTKVSRIRLKNSATGNLFNLVAGATPVQSVHFKHLQIDGNSAGQTASTSHGLYFPTYVSGEDNFSRVEACYIHDFVSDCINSEYGRRGIKVLASQLYRSRNGWFCSSSDGGVYETIIAAMSQDGMQLHDWTMKISGCDIFANRNGINTFSGEANLTTIVGNMLDRNQQSAMVLNGKTATVIGNCMHQNGLAAQATYATINVGGDYNVICGNTFRGPVTGGINLPIYSILQAANTTNTISDNVEVAGGSVGGLFHAGSNAVTYAGAMRIARLSAITAANAQIIVPANHVLDSITVFNTTANSVTGGLKFGTTSGGAEVLSSLDVAASSFAIGNAGNLLKTIFSATADQILYFDAIGSWNSANIKVTVTTHYIG